MIKNDVTTNKKSNKKKTLAITALLCGAILAGGAALMIGGASAYLTDTDTATNTFTVGEVTIDTIEPNFPGNGSDEVRDLVPFEEVKKDPQVKNTGKNRIVVFQQIDIPMANIIVANEKGKRQPQANTEIFDFKTTNGTYDSYHSEKWVLLSTKYLNKDDAEVSSGTAAKVRRLYGYSTVVEENQTTVPVFDVVRLCNVIEGNIDNSIQNIVITTYAIQADNIAGITNENWTQTMNAAKLNEIFTVYMNQSADVKPDDADNNNNQTLIDTTLNVTMTVANTHLKINSGNSADAQTTTVCNVAYTGPNKTKPTAKFESSDTRVATVDANGNIKAVGVGKATITASAINPDTGHEATASVVVTVRDMNAGE